MSELKTYETQEQIVARILAEYGVMTRADGGYGVAGSVVRYRGRGDCGERLWECNCSASLRGDDCEHIQRVMDCNAAICDELGQE
jgi:hypothetical protein